MWRLEWWMAGSATARGVVVGRRAGAWNRSAQKHGEQELQPSGQDWISRRSEGNHQSRHRGGRGGHGDRDEP